MNNERPPQDRRPAPTDNPFDNPELDPGDHEVSPHHESDHPGRDYEVAGARSAAPATSGADLERHPSSGAHGPSEPRRPGTGERQGRRRRSDDQLTSVDAVVPGEILLADGDIVINEGRPVTRLRVTNTADRPIQVGSHFHFAEVNSALEFDREQAWAKRLNVLSGGAVRFEPGDVEDVELVPFAGKRVARGFRGLCKGDLDA